MKTRHDIINELKKGARRIYSNTWYYTKIYEMEKKYNIKPEKQYTQFNEMYYGYYENDANIIILNIKLIIDKKTKKDIKPKSEYKPQTMSTKEIIKELKKEGVVYSGGYSSYSVRISEARRFLRIEPIDKKGHMFIYSLEDGKKIVQYTVQRYREIYEGKIINVEKVQQTSEEETSTKEKTNRQYIEWLVQELKEVMRKNLELESEIQKLKTEQTKKKRKKFLLWG